MSSSAAATSTLKIIPQNKETANSPPDTADTVPQQDFAVETLTLWQELNRVPELS